MRRASVSYSPGFRVLIGDDHSQAASMVIAPGDTEGGPENRHRGADQWLYVESGSGEAVINGHSYPIEAGALILMMTAVNELTLSALLWSSGNETIGVMVFALQYEGNSTAAAAVSAVSVALVLGMALALDRLAPHLPRGTLPWRG